MKNFIPNDNNINKLIAFTPSLNKDWRKGQRIFTNPNQIETLDIVENLQDEGWNIKGSFQTTNHLNRINKNVIKLEHPDMALKNGSTTEGNANLLITSKLNENYDINTDLGFMRLVCSNGLVSREKEYSYDFNCIKDNEASLKEFMEGLNINTSHLFNEIEKMNLIELNSFQQKELAEKGLNLRFGNNNDVNYKQLLNCVRDADLGPQLWKVFNRVQENLTQNHRITNKNGKLLAGVTNPLIDMEINQGLYTEARKLQYA